MNGILSQIRAEKEYTQLVKGLLDSVRFRKNLPHGVTGLCEGAAYAVYAALISDYQAQTGKGALMVVADEKQAERLCAAFKACGLLALFYPERDFVYYNITSSHEFEYQRIGVLNAVLQKKFDVVVSTPAAILQRTIPRQHLERCSLTLHVGDQIDLRRLCEDAALAGYQRAETADVPGLFSVRGGIFDIYGTGANDPVRLEFFGDEIDSVNYYDPETQRRTEPQQTAEILPAREVLIDDESRRQILDVLSSLLDKADGRTSDTLRQEVLSVSEGAEIRFADRFIDCVYHENTCLLDYFEKDSLFLSVDRNALEEQIKAFEWRISQNIETLLEEHLIDGGHAVYARTGDDLRERMRSGSGVLFDTFGASYAGMELSALYHFPTKHTVSYIGRPELLIEDIRNYFSMGYVVDVLCDTEISAKHMENFLSQHQIVWAADDKKRPANTIVLYYGVPFSGFELPNRRYVCLSLTEDAAQRRKKEKRKKAANRASKNERILSYADLSVGDYVVHANHGIGIYAGIQTLTVDGAIKDFVKIQYAGKDVLYLPCDQLGMLSKYIGARSEDGTLKLSKMGGTEWIKAKSRAKAATKEMARELIRLYAQRTRLPGFAFAKDDEFQEEFEAAFMFEETDGQSVAADEIKADMEKPYPMDRLLCGDVGFGKTEVAMRAAFKAAMNNKQVAILVPTTILAMQHYETFCSRMRGFPINIDLLCRFRTAQQQAESVKKLKDGKTDIIIGTHRMLSADIRFRDLGLLIVDEEQRFGVGHKEKLKQISKNIDVLTLSATPIPRTLNMAMSGIRDMSILEEAPGERLPVQSYVLEYDEIIIADAIRRELRRGGQVFYLCNNIENIDRVIAKINQMVPDARAAGAHGRMEREELSQIWRSLLNAEIDVLVSTTIIESGIDIPSANTLIIENADRFGLSQLHQIRGRVGRSSRRAYAYFTFPKGKALSEIAAKRLAAIREYTEFGSGFRIALRDLEIRGAGNVLGAEQHGHMDSVGYDLYMRLLNEAVLEEKGEKVESPGECTVNYGKSAYIPENYIRSASQRIWAYRKISDLTCPQEMSDLLDELIDRYGEMPKPVYTLIQVSLLRVSAARCGISSISCSEGAFTLQQEPFDFERWFSLSRANSRLIVHASAKPYAVFRPEKGKNDLTEMLSLIAQYEERR